MPNNACTIILNGHGHFDYCKIVNNVNGYNIVFLCKHTEIITVAHHNLVLSYLSCCEKSQILPNLQIIEELYTTSIVNNNQVTHSELIDMTNKHLNLCYEHIISNVYNVYGAHTLLNFISNRFCAAELIIIQDCTNPITIIEGVNLSFEFDIIQAQKDVCIAIESDEKSSSSALSKNNLIYIRPTAPDGKEARFFLSNFINDILPKIKIFASKHQDHSVDVLPQIFLDGRNNFEQNFQNLVETFPIFQNDGDSLHELTIAGDANIIWDSCRESG